MAVKKTNQVEEAEAVETAAAEAEKPKTVKIKLFKDNGKYKGDQFVAVNGRTYKLQRGVTVEVPVEVEEVLRHSERQDEMTSDRISTAEANAAKAAK